MQRDVRVFADLDELSRAAAEAATATIASAVERAGRCSLVLSGGSTPRAFYGMLASDFRDRIPWEHVHLFWGDERFVPASDPNSNYRMAREALLDHISCPPSHIHPMPTHLPSAEAAAREYEATLKDLLGGGRPDFDLVLLGLGEDGHTASLFPRSPALDESTRWVVATRAPVEPRVRLTLTLPAITGAAGISVLVSGSRKSTALRHVLSDDVDPTLYPAAGIRRTRGKLTWWVDEAAADQHAPPRR